ncbi:MAG: TIGR03643 family protein [Bacteroidota bacterium]|nr:TIGR03643 family protein [Bacteroidota bacterium]
MTSLATLSVTEIDRIIEMAWEDRTTFEAIEKQFGLKQQDVIKLMRNEMKASSFKMWRTRTKGRSTKHEALRSNEVDRFKCSRQKSISHNKISKR